MKDLARFLAVLFIIIPLSALMWNLFELPAMLDLTRENYLSLQNIDSGLSWLVIFEIFGLLMTGILLLMEKKKKRTYRSLLVAVICFAVSIAAFFIFVLPENIRTENWTLMPENWDAIRAQWEYATAIRAVVNFAGFSFVVVSLLQNRNYYRVYV